ncbi:MAG: 50S ribosomal protein L17 [Armatimonadota bacterium]
MRHRNGMKRMGRPTDQRLAIIKSLVAGVLQHGYVTTTEVRAKEARRVIERVITLSREDTLSNRRLVRRWIPIGEAVTTREKYENVHGEALPYSLAPKVTGDAKKGIKGTGPRGLKAADRRPSGEVLIHKLFTEIGPQFKDRPGGYLRLTRLGGESHINAKGVLTVRGSRRGDGAMLVKMELV